MTILSQEGNVSSVSPYLLQPIRSLDEARKEIEAKRSAARDSKWFLRHHLSPPGSGCRHDRAPVQKLP